MHERSPEIKCSTYNFTLSYFLILKTICLLEVTVSKNSGVVKQQVILLIVGMQDSLCKLDNNRSLVQ